MDARLGCLSVHLDTPQCFSAEIYAVDLDVTGAQEDLKVCAKTYHYAAHWLHFFLTNSSAMFLCLGRKLDNLFPFFVNHS